MKYQLVLWDFDGTLADTLSLALDIYNRMAAQKRFRQITDPLAVRHMGMRQFLKSHGISLHQVPSVFSAFLSEFRSQATEVSLHKGIGRTIERVSAMGIRQGIVSSNSTGNIRRCLESNDVVSHFEYISGTSGIFGKEKRIRTAFRKLKLNASDVLYIGDEVRDIEACLAAGLDMAAVTWGLNSAELLSASGPKYVISRPGELLSILRE